MKPDQNPTVTLAIHPAIWDARWTADGDTRSHRGTSISQAAVEAAGASTFTRHVDLTSAHTWSGDRVVPFAALWRPTFEALRDAARPVLITHMMIGEEHLALQNLKVLLGPNPSMLEACRNPFAEQLCGMGGASMVACATKTVERGNQETGLMVVEVDLNRWDFTKYIDDPKLRNGRVPIGHSTRLLWWQGHTKEKILFEACKAWQEADKMSQAS